MFTIIYKTQKVKWLVNIFRMERNRILKKLYMSYLGEVQTNGQQCLIFTSLAHMKT